MLELGRFYDSYFPLFHICPSKPTLARLCFFKKCGWFKESPGIELSLAYATTIFFYGLLASLTYGLSLSPWIPRGLTWLALLGGAAVFIKYHYWQELAQLKFPLVCLVLMSAFSLAFISLPFNITQTYVPDPRPIPGHNYST